MKSQRNVVFPVRERMGKKLKQKCENLLKIKPLRLFIPVLYVALYFPGKLVADPDISITQRNVAGDNLINFFTPAKFGRIAFRFASQPTYTESLAKYPVIPDPTFDEWLKTKLDSNVDTETNKIAYTEFLKGKRLLESSNDLAIYPSFPTDIRETKQAATETQAILKKAGQNLPDGIDEYLAEAVAKSSSSSYNKKNCNGDICPNYPQFFSALDALQTSMHISANAWTQFYRGIALLRIRAFEPASKDLGAAQQHFDLLNLPKAARLANSFNQSIVKWQVDRKHKVSGLFTPLDCPNTPDKIKEAFDGDMGVCTLIFCGNWKGSENKTTRQQVIAETLHKALTSLRTKSADQIKHDPIYTCAIGVTDNEKSIQQDVSEKLIDFMKSVAVFNNFDRHFFNLELIYLEKGDDDEALTLLKNNLDIISKNSTPLELALGYALNINIVSEEALDRRLTILGISGNDRDVLMQLKSAGLVQNIAAKSVANKVLNRFNQNLTPNKLLTSTCIASGTFVCAIQTMFSGITLGVGAEKFYEEVGRVLRSIEDYLIHEGVTTAEANAFSHYQAAIARLVELRDLPSDIPRVVELWLTYRAEIRETIENVAEATVESLNLPMDQRQRFKFSVYSLAEQAVMTALLSKDIDSENSLGKKLDPLAVTLLNLFSNINKSEVPVQEMLLKDLNNIVKTSKLNAKNAAFVGEGFRCLIYVDTSLDCQQTSLKLFEQFVSLFDKKNSNNLSQVFVDIGKRAKQRASKSLSRGETYTEAIIHSGKAALSELENAKSLKLLNEDEKRFLWTTAMAFENYLDKNTAIMLADKIQFGTQLPTSPFGEYAFVGSAWQLCEGSPAFSVTAEQTAKLHSPIALGFVLASPCLISRMSLTELSSLLSQINNLNYGSKALTAQFIVMAFILDSSFKTQRLGFDHTSLLVEHIGQYQGGNVNLVVPLSISLQTYIPYIVPEESKVFHLDSGQMVENTYGNRAGISYSRHGIFANFYGSLPKADIDRVSREAKIQSAARSKRWDYLEGEVAIINGMNKIEDEDVRWLTKIAAALLTAENPPEHLKATALAWAESYRSYPSLYEDIRLSLLNGLITKPFTLKSIQVYGLKKINAGKFFSVFGLENGVTISDKILINGLRKLYDNNLINDVTVEIKDGIILLSVKEA